MSLDRFITDAISPWMRKSGPDTDIALSSRIRLARNLDDYIFPLFSSSEEAIKVVDHVATHVLGEEHTATNRFELLKMNDLTSLTKHVLVEKHLISPHLAEQSKHGAVLLSEDEAISIMINEEDHLRIQCLFSGFQLKEALTLANGIDDWLEEKFTYAFDEEHGYLTSCPTNVGTGLRASVMMHLPALVMTQQLTRVIPAINQLGLVVRGIYGEGSEALGNLFQISNQITLGKSESDIVDDLHSVVLQLIQQERSAREMLMNNSRLQLEDRVCRSFGILAHARMIESKEAAQRLSDVKLGIDLGFIQGVTGNIFNELMILTQPAFLQQYAKEVLSAQARDERRAMFIRERLQLEEQ